jgi:hypothetical protein
MACVSSMIIICHPDNWNKVKSQFSSATLQQFEIRTDPYVERDKLSGKYVLPNGKRVVRQDIHIRTRFITYGPEDFDYLLYAKIISEDREMVFYVMDDSKLRSYLEPQKPQFLWSR